MALNTLPATAFADDAITADKINLANTFAFTGTVTGASKLINSNKAKFTGGTVTITSQSSTVDTGIDHTFTATSTNNKLLHIITCNGWRQVPDGGYPGMLTIYADDSPISEINHEAGLGEWHQDGGTTQITAGALQYFGDAPSTSTVKYSLYGRGQDFRIQNSSTTPLFWTILEIAP
jgi:hypothetical protein